MLHKTPLNKILAKIPAIQFPILKQLHNTCKQRIDRHIDKHKGTGHVKEYELMHEFEKRRIIPYIIAVEYEINDGVSMDHSGDVMGYDGSNTLFVIELKCIKYHKHQHIRIAKVQDQAGKLHKRLCSWVNHLTTIDARMEALKDFDIKKGYYTDDKKDDLIFL